MAKYLPTRLTKDRLAQMLRADLGATSLYLYLVAEQDLAGNQAGVTFSVNEVRRWVLRYSGRKPSWSQTNRAVWDLFMSGLVTREEGPSQTHRVKPSVSPLSRIPETKDPVNGSRDPVNGSPKPGIPLRSSYRREGKRSLKATSSYPPMVSETVAAEQPPAAPDGAPPAAPPIGSRIDPGDSTTHDGLPGDDARQRALADRSVAALAAELRAPVAPPPVDGDAAARRREELRAQLAALEEVD